MRVPPACLGVVPGGGAASTYFSVPFLPPVIRRRDCNAQAAILDASLATLLRQFLSN
jgi:hypothetical protein